MKSANPSSPGAEAALKHGQRPVPLVIALLFGPALFAMGLLVFGLLTGHLPSQAGALRVPAMILWLTGLLFTTAGLGLLLSRFLPKPAGFCGVIALCSFVGIFNWIAFGPGDREFTRSTKAAGGAASTAHSSALSETGGRLVFGLFAGALDALILYGLYQGLRRRNVPNTEIRN